MIHNPIREAESAVKVLEFRYGPPCCPPPGSLVRFATRHNYPRFFLSRWLLRFLFALRLTENQWYTTTKIPISDTVPPRIAFSEPNVSSQTNQHPERIMHQGARGECPKCRYRWSIDLRSWVDSGQAKHEVCWSVSKRTRSRHILGSTRLYIISDCPHCGETWSRYESISPLYKNRAYCRACHREEFL